MESFWTARDSVQTASSLESAEVSELLSFGEQLVR